MGKAALLLRLNAHLQALEASVGGGSPGVRLAGVDAKVPGVWRPAKLISCQHWHLKAEGRLQQRLVLSVRKHHSWQATEGPHFQCSSPRSQKSLTKHLRSCWCGRVAFEVLLARPGQVTPRRHFDGRAQNGRACPVRLAARRL